jgi:hypothetical protein
MKKLWVAATLGILLIPAAAGLPFSVDAPPKRQPDMTVFNPYEMAVERYGITVVR